MSELWHCDFPNCSNESGLHEGWERAEAMPKGAYLLFAIPFLGNILALLGMVLSDKYMGAIHFCPEHTNVIFRKEQP